jgi:hypothetical protein
MKPRSPLPHEKPLAVIAISLSLVFAARAAQPRPSAPAPAPAAATNALPAAVIPKSVFIMPATPQEGRDPFFPRSIRPYGPGHETVKASPQQPAAVVVDLRLNGISGTAERRLAIINNHTFEVNEEGMVSNASGTPVRIRCLEIKADSVLVQIGSEQRILRLRSGF